MGKRVHGSGIFIIKPDRSYYVQYTCNEIKSAVDGVLFFDAPNAHLIAHLAQVMFARHEHKDLRFPERIFTLMN